MTSATSDGDRDGSRTFVALWSMQKLWKKAAVAGYRYSSS